jgi:hypothetical protein
MLGSHTDSENWLWENQAIPAVQRIIDQLTNLYQSHITIMFTNVSVFLLIPTQFILVSDLFYRILICSNDN